MRNCSTLFVVVAADEVGVVGEECHRTGLIAGFEWSFNGKAELAGFLKHTLHEHKLNGVCSEL